MRRLGVLVRSYHGLPRTRQHCLLICGEGGGREAVRFRAGGEERGVVDRVVEALAAVCVGVVEEDWLGCARNAKPPGLAGGAKRGKGG